MTTQRITTVLTTTTTTVRKETRLSASPNISAERSPQKARPAKAPASSMFYEYFARGMYRIKQAGGKPKPAGSTRKSIDLKKR